MRLLFILSALFVCSVLLTPAQNQEKDRITLYKLKDNSADTLRLNRVVLIETDTSTVIGEPVYLKDSLMMFKANSYGALKRDTSLLIDLNYVAGLGYCKDNVSDKLMNKFRKKGALFSNRPAYVSGALGLAAILLSITDRNFVNIFDDATNKNVTRAGAAAITFSITYTAFHYFYHRSKIKYYDINANWSLTPVIRK